MSKNKLIWDLEYDTRCVNPFRLCHYNAREGVNVLYVYPNLSKAIRKIKSITKKVSGGGSE